MKSKILAFPRNLVLTSSALMAVLAPISISAATFTWTGAASTSWVPNTGNWNPNPAVFGNAADFILNTVPNDDMFLGFGRVVRSISFGADIDSNVGVSFQTTAGGTTAANLTFDTDVVNGDATVTVDTGSTGNITLGNALGGTTGFPVLADNLVVNHNGSGLLLFNRPFQAAAFGITKTGTGRMQTNNNNLLTGPLNINQGTLIANTFGQSGDVGTFSSVNLNGGTLQVNHNSDTGNTKSYTNPFTVTTASKVAFFNSTSGSEAFSLAGPATLDLTPSAADLTMQNISSDTTLNNYMSIDRNITGAGDIIVETYNNINSGTTNFGLGRVGIGGINTGWSGALEIRKGTAQILGNYATADKRLGTGDIILGATGDSFGAGLLLYADNGNGSKAYTNNITVRSGGFRTIRPGSDHTYTFSGNIALEGDLNVHNGLFFTDKFVLLTGNISGTGNLNLTKGTSGASVRLSGDSGTWSGGLAIAQGTVEIRGASDTSAGTGLVTIGATGDASAAVLTFVPGATGGTTLTYENDITVTSGGSRTINGGDTNHNVTLAGGITLNGDLSVNHAWSTSDRRFNFNGPISGNGGLTVTRTYGNAETTLRMAGTNTYLGDTTVSSSASLSLASTCSLTSDVLVQATGRIGGPGLIDGTLTLAATANFYFFVGSSTPATYVPMKVNGTVALDNSFGVGSIVGGSRGEAVPWGTIPDGTYTLISNTASTFNTISNFGPGGAATNVAGSGKTVYFQNGGGTGNGGLQIVIAPDAATPYSSWSGGAAFNVDTNNDGIGNGLAFLLGADNVNSNANGLLPRPTQTGGALTLTFKMRNSAARGTASLQMQHSSDLGISDAWSSLVTVPDIDNTVGGIVFDITAGTPLNDVTATIPASGNAAGGKLFGRVKSNP
jgi:fibronectin-binding autotransporter adhesin